MFIGSGYFGGLKILNFNIFGGFQKTEYFWGYEDFVDIFGGTAQNWTIFIGISMHFRVFSERQGTEWRIFFGLLKFQKISSGA